MKSSPSNSVDVVIFGGTGDLALRKLLPALYRLQGYELVNKVGRIFGLGRSDQDNAAYRAQVKEKLSGYLSEHEWSEERWARFESLLHYQQLDATQTEHFQGLKEALAVDAGVEKVFYLATLPSLYGAICEQLSHADLVDEHTRVVLEKPLGHDLKTCQSINEQVADVFPERNTFRIDHYLGKETIQNLLALRFGNALFNPLWNNHHVDNVQITVAESLGVEGRGDYYAKSGALRDMVQNHLLQVMCLVAMEPPASLDSDAIRDEKVKVLRSLKPINSANVKRHTVRGQYAEGASEGKPVAGFLQETEAPGSADTETFVAIEAEIDNWRWADVPFYLRTGKRLSQRYSEIVVEFKKHPFSLFGNKDNEEANKLVIKIQPEETITLHMLNKKPGLTGQLKLQPVELDLTQVNDSENDDYDAYERLLLDVINSDQTLFMRRDEVEAAWNWIDGIRDAWQESHQSLKPYIAGTMGPSKATALTERTGRSWHE